ncbi:glycosyltransferase family 4 protein [Hydrogenophaga sp.]|uniref:glycosyltransferase family 4 protein n=1 Tax=Hydrogenophaga sp. TaxID=1904254 RepID=UPI00271F83C5|nr:glycosyltransferase family 4 protein [Hydrogenophaga sp.]MDO9605970.1 glycosyltransferase family 4 protein [Hydrogenophaga sp.]
MKIILFANTEWYLYNFRRSLALALRDAGHEVLLVSPPGPYGERLRALGFRWVPAPMDRRSLNPLRELALLQWLRRLLVQEQVDLVHGFTIKCAVYGSLAARLAARSPGIPARVNAVAGMGYVFTSNDLKARLLRPVVRGLLRLALGGRGARLILQNPDDVALFERARLVDATQVRLIPGSGVDCRRFTPPSPLLPGARPEAGGRFRVLLPARLLWDKGLAEYVAAARELRAQGLAIDFLLAGDPDPGNPAAVPEATVRGWVAEGLVQWLGHVDDMAALFATVHAVVLPSYREGLPKGLIEAGACGLPLVTTDVPGCREVVSDGVDGLLVPVKDAPALARAIARLHDDPALCARLGAAARARALAEFDERIVIGRTVDVYRELLGAAVDGAGLPVRSDAGAGEVPASATVTANVKAG